MHGQCDLPVDACFLQVSAGGHHSVLIHEDGDAVAFGSNSDHQCSIPERKESPPIRYVAASAGLKHTVLISEDGRAVAFGNNISGQCDIPPLEAGIMYLKASAGASHTVLLRSDGQAVIIGQHRCLNATAAWINPPAVHGFQSWTDFLQTRPVLPEGITYIPDTSETPVGVKSNGAVNNLLVTLCPELCEASYAVKCMSMAGNILAEIEVPSDVTVGDLQETVARKFVFPWRRLQVTLPSGSKLDEHGLHERFSDLLVEVKREA